VPVVDTDEGFTNFDGITYGKGASVLRQLQALLGADVFRQGVRDYLAANAWSNTELDDFMGAMAAAADRNLDDWTQRWLYTAGLNSIEAGFSCEAGLLTSLRLLQHRAGGVPRVAPAAHPASLVSAAGRGTGS